jgi:hypothetical protein
LHNAILYNALTALPSLPSPINYAVRYVKRGSAPQPSASLRLGSVLRLSSPPRRIIALCKIAPTHHPKHGSPHSPVKAQFSIAPHNWLLREISSTHWKRTPSAAFQIVYFSDFVYVHASLRQNLKQNLTA